MIKFLNKAVSDHQYKLYVVRSDGLLKTEIVKISETKMRFLQHTIGESRNGLMNLNKVTVCIKEANLQFALNLFSVRLKIVEDIYKDGAKFFRVEKFYAKIRK